MSDSQNDFSPLFIDQQIDEPDALLSPDNALFLHEVRAMFEQEKSASIEQGWTRLMNQRASAAQTPEVLDLSRYRQRNERISTMNDREEMFAPPQPAAPKKRLPRLLGLLAAALVCVTLVGSLAFVLAAVKGQYANTMLGGHGTAPVVQKSTPVPTATPTLTIPASCKDDLDLADERLCALGQETPINITRNFTAHTYYPNGSVSGAGTISVTFQRAYADPTRLLLISTINRAPHTDWGGFVTLSTREGMIGSYGSPLFQGFAVQTFDTNTLPAGITQLHVQSINLMSGLSIPLNFTLPFHSASKTVTVKQTVSGNGYTFTLDHLVLTGSVTSLVVSYTTTNPPTKDVQFRPQLNLQTIVINGQNQGKIVGWSGHFGGDNTGSHGQMDFHQSFLDQPGFWSVTITLTQFKPGPAPTPSTVFTGTFAFTVPA